MGIDGIGKGGAPPAIASAGTGEVSRGAAADATSPFEVPGASRPADAAAIDSATAPAATSETGATGATAARATDALHALRSGAVDLDGYLDLKVSEATAHLGPLPAADLVRVRAALRERLATDPTLVDLVKSATGSAPRVPDDD
jgi:hypothetical protein